MKYPLADFRQSPNYKKGRKEDIIDIVIHVTDGGSNLQRAVEHLSKKESQVSAHFLIGQAGEVVQLVDTDDTAWHAKGVNNQSIGIEHCARSPKELSPDDPGLDFTEDQYLSSVKLVKWLLEQYKLTTDNVLGHCDLKDNEGNYLSNHKDCPWGAINREKYFHLLSS